MISKPNARKELFRAGCGEPRHDDMVWRAIQEALRIKCRAASRSLVCLRVSRSINSLYEMVGDQATGEAGDD